MARIPEAEARIFGKVFVCRKCKTKMRGDPAKFRARGIVCRRCGRRDFRPKKCEKKVVK